MGERVKADKICGWYVDRSGRRWLCVERTTRGTIVCEGDDGSFTAADNATFAAWGWTPEDRRHPPHSTKRG